jgi:hypothetical protein
MNITGLKTEPNVVSSYKIFEMDELYWFAIRKPKKDEGETIYLTTLISRSPRQIVGFDVAFNKAPERTQK